MTQRIADMRQFFVTDKRHHKARRPPGDPWELARRFEKERTPDLDRADIRLRFVLDRERPVLFPGERIAFTRTGPTIPELFTQTEMAALRKLHWIHELGDVCNICVDYTRLLSCGFDAKRAQLRGVREDFQHQGDTDAVHYLDIQIGLLDAVQRLADRYRALALEQGNAVVAQTLSHVPAKAPGSFLEALQMLRILHFTLWCGRNYHNTLGRLDQYLYPYFRADLDTGSLDTAGALELLEEFFLSFNRDSDLYPGIQQGDNGQSVVLGGRDADGRECFNELSTLCLKAALELRVIDPKINLRVCRDTPLETYVLGTRLTQQGLGFPQYCGDEVVIPGLTALGYDERDARSYAVAACWEFIIPGLAMDIPNIGALSFPKAVEDAVFEKLEDCESYGAFEAAVRENIRLQAGALCDRTQSLYLFPAPFPSLMMHGCSEHAHDVSLGCKYNNYGLHGAGISTAADSMAAVKKYVFDERSITAAQLIGALKKDFQGDQALCNKLRYEGPKMGNNLDEVDDIASLLLMEFADALQGRVNDRGGVFRPGTGSAMYYIQHAKELPATPDGRRAGESFAANYSPSLFSRCKGPVSILQSFSKPDLKRVVNGGPLTLELHDTVFRTPDSVRKVAMLVKSFMDMGGHQIQLNAVNRETLLDAQKHPENHHNLIVRVWGWSGYFVELDKEYQDHILQRMELNV